ncbi:hypothetical protein FLBR109950_11055 [Flavobacterium branchiophilum]|uniref:Uncharacterized protein n=1 Tax=Flavobacterium branchiophilum (strain FL-15) TaxID=1034807 RepID=G2Z4B6_FLABF|nr:hypothetical protein [Flavobacterium branchiophilum]CCB70610.1 Hypothetical protein FBFL15_2613 [Flavobacterium branchiophilum FL-15]
MRDVDAQILVNQTNNKMLAQAPHPDLSGALFFLPLKGLLGLRQEKKAGTEGGSGAQKNEFMELMVCANDVDAVATMGFEKN